MRIVATLAQEDRTVGGEDVVPWEIPDVEEQIFDEIRDKVIVVGRRSWSLVGDRFPCSRAVVLSRSPGRLDDDVPTRAIFVPDLKVALENARAIDPEGEILVVGGGTVFRQALPFAHNMTLAMVKRPIAGDLRFPDFTDREWWLEDAWEHPSFEVLRYQRRVVA